MNKFFSIFIFLFLLSSTLNSNSFDTKNYEQLKKELNKKYKNQKPKEWGENVTGVKSKINTNDKLIAITMDACGSPHGMGFDKELINFLEKHNIPATLFINARWIDRNLEIFKTLAKKPLFEIGNHGLLHKPASVNGKSVYNLKGTKNIDELIDEIELNAKKIESITNKRPKYFRSGTAYYDEIAVKIANELNHEVIGFSILGDAGATFNAKKVEESILNSKEGDIIIVHFNHPLSQTKEGMIKALLKLKKEGYKFVKLSDYSLK